MKILEYFMVRETTQKDLNEEVNGFIQLGWEPLGGISIAGNGDRNTYCQAMVLRGEK